MTGEPKSPNLSSSESEKAKRASEIEARFNELEAKRVIQQEIENRYYEFELGRKPTRDEIKIRDFAMKEVQQIEKEQAALKREYRTLGLDDNELGGL
jgi:DNA polymerase sigma